MCSSRYGGSYPCSALQYYGTWIVLPIVVVIGLFSHQGYRYRRRRQSLFTRDDTVQSEALLESSGHQVGLDPGGPGLPGQPSSAGFAPPGAPPVARPPGWYPDPDRPGQQRYWYGDAWAPSLAPGAAPGGVPGPPIGAPPTAPPGPTDRPEDAPGWGAASF
jgi:hypothetical protein